MTREELLEIVEAEMEELALQSEFFGQHGPTDSKFFEKLVKKKGYFQQIIEDYNDESFADLYNRYGIYIDLRNDVPMDNIVMKKLAGAYDVVFPDIE